MGSGGNFLSRTTPNPGGKGRSGRWPEERGEQVITIKGGKKFSKLKKRVLSGEHNEKIPNQETALKRHEDHSVREKGLGPEERQSSYQRSRQ